MEHTTAPDNAGLDPISASTKGRAQGSPGASTLRFEYAQTKGLAWSPTSAVLRKTNYQQVLEFTEGSMGKNCPKTPQPMNRQEVEFIIKMIQSELCELAQTVTANSEEALKLLHDCIGVDVKTQYVAPTDEVELIADQYDAFVDIWYYALNCSCKKGVDLSSIFDVVHEANMAKRFEDGTFHRREDGKVIKPPGWREPDVKGEILRQLRRFKPTTIVIKDYGGEDDESL